MGSPALQADALPTELSGKPSLYANWMVIRLTVVTILQYIQTSNHHVVRGPMDCSLSGSSAHGIFQARVLEWGAIAFSVHLKQTTNSYTFES